MSLARGTLGPEKHAGTPFIRKVCADYEDGSDAAEPLLHLAKRRTRDRPTA